MIERIWLLTRKRVVSPVVLLIFCALLSVFFVLMHMGKHIPMLLIVAVGYSFSLILIQIGYYMLQSWKLLKTVKENVNYDEMYEMFAKEVDWYLGGETCPMQLYIYPGWTQYFHVYMMELVRNHAYREITDATVLAALTKALVMKHDDISFIAEFIDAEADRFRMPKTYTVKRNEDGSCTFTVKDRKKYQCFEHMEQALGMDFVAEHVKHLLMDNATLTDLEEFFDNLYYCGKDMKD